MDSLHNELKIEIFKYVDSPLSLLLTNRRWYVISQDPYTRANWLIYKYGRAHALLHAVRLGRNFISLNVVHTLIIKGSIISRYFIQRLALQFGNPDQRLIKLRAQYHGNSSLHQKGSWASELDLQIYMHLLTKASTALRECDLVLKGNDMELFHFLTGGPFAINHVSQTIHKNLECIKDLILNKKFIPFPPRPKCTISSIPTITSPTPTSNS